MHVNAYMVCGLIRCFGTLIGKSIKLIDIMNVRINVACLERLVMSKKAKDLGRKGVSFYIQERVIQEMV